MKNALTFALFLAAALLPLACKTEHKVAVETPQPIKIEARIDVYLHAETIEDMVSGKTPIPEADAQKPDKESALRGLLRGLFCAAEAWAQDIPFKTFTEEIRSALQRRKDRYPQVEALLAAGKVANSPSGYLEPSGSLTQEEKGLVNEENKDRKFIYKELAKQNNLTLEQVEAAFGKVQKDS